MVARKEYLKKQSRTWSDEELRVIEDEYMEKRWEGVYKKLRKIGFHRTPDAIETRASAFFGKTRTLLKSKRLSIKNCVYPRKVIGRFRDVYSKDQIMDYLEKTGYPINDIQYELILKSI